MSSLNRVENYDNMLTIKYYLFSILRNVLLYLPVLVLFLENTLNNSIKVGTVLLVKSLTVAIFELPMGYFSDVISRKFSLSLSIALNIFSLLFFIFNPTFFTLIVAEILFGISETFSSGSDIALIYDNYKYKGNLDSYEIYQRNEIFILSIILALSFFLGSIIYNFNQEVVFWIPLLCFLISFLVLMKIPEYPYKESDSNKIKFVENLKSSISIILNSKKKLKNHILYGIFLNGLFTCVYMFLFPIVLNSHVSSKIIYGLIYAVSVSLIGFGAKVQIKVDAKKIRILPVLVALVFFCSYIINNSSFFIVFSLLFMRFIWGIFNSYFIINLNHLIENSSVRATFFSAYGALINLFSGILIFVFGVLLEKLPNINYIFLILVGAFLLIFFIQEAITNKKSHINSY